jgi:hypothetical protein
MNASWNGGQRGGTINLAKQKKAGDEMIAAVFESFKS